MMLAFLLNVSFSHGETISGVTEPIAHYLTPHFTHSESKDGL